MASATLWPSTEGAVALVTCADLPDLDDDTVHLVKPLETHGVAACRTVWDDPAVDWDRFDLCVVRRRPVVLELELIEPQLHLAFAPSGAQRLAKAIAARARLERLGSREIA